jgi:tripartite-type tricarboxylate transporter receptor subunit TctC
MRAVTLLVVLGSAAAVPVAAAQDYPVRPVRIIVPFAPGGATDIVTRIVGKSLTEMWRQTVVVDNRAGAGGNIGAELAARATPDGYTLFMPSGSVMTANQHMYRKIPFHPEKDFVAITNVASGPQIVAIANALAARSVKELISFAKSKPRSINFGSAGVGTQTHLAAESFLYAAGIDAVHVPYKGEGPALTELVGGQIQLLTPNLSAAIGFVNAGRIRALAVTSRQRVPQIPDVPTVAETLPGFENLGWFGLVAPAATPRAVVQRIHADVVKVLRSTEVGRRFEELGMAPVGNTPAEFTQAMRAESARWEKVIRERKLTVN